MIGVFGGGRSAELLVALKPDQNPKCGPCLPASPACLPWAEQLVFSASLIVLQASYGKKCEQQPQAVTYNRIFPIVVCFLPFPALMCFFANRPQRITRSKNRAKHVTRHSKYKLGVGDKCLSIRGHSKYQFGARGHSRYKTWYLNALEIQIRCLRSFELIRFLRTF